MEYTATNSQAIQNVRSTLDNLRYTDGKHWDSHVGKFNGLIAKLSSFGTDIPEREDGSDDSISPRVFCFDEYHFVYHWRRVHELTRCYSIRD